ncbi:putative exonuclease [Aerococcus phage vB_AviM_AVP]|nr:putative exonuclease [Aerococcus phage vB_AviM_AVP]
MFKFKKIKAKNFLSYKDLELDLDKRGLILVEGKNLTNSAFLSNGSAKSSLLSTVTYALYGKTEKGQTADEVVNNKVGKDTSVKLYFDVDEQAYRIERYRKDKKNKNQVKLFKGNDEIKTNSAKETNQRILDLFGIDYSAYINSISIGQGSETSFSDATDKQKKEILENVANIAIYARAQEVAKQKVTDTQTNLAEYKNKLANYESEKDKFETLKQSEQDKYDNAMSYYSSAQELLNEAEGKYKDLVEKANLDTLNDQRDKLLYEREGIKYLIDNKEPKRTFTLDTSEYENKISELQIILNKFSAEKMSKENEVNNLKVSYNSFNTATVCPTCGSPLDPTHALNEQEKIINQVSKIKEYITQLEGGISMTNKKITEAKQELQDKQTEFNEFVADRDREYDSIVAVNQKAYFDKQQEVNNIQSQIDKVNNDIQNAYNTMEHYRWDLEKREQPNPPYDYKEELDKLEKDNKENMEKVDKLTDDMLEYEQVVKMYSNSGVRSIVLDNITPYLNEQANKYLAILAGSTIQINLTTQKENKDGSISDKFEVEVYNASGGSDYKSASAGERKRIDLAISFALQDLVIKQNNTSVNLLMLDEVFENLDEVANENVITLLEEKAKEVESIFVITHNEQLKGLFSNKVTVVKEQDGISKLED